MDSRRLKTLLVMLLSQLPAFVAQAPLSALAAQGVVCPDFRERLRALLDSAFNKQEAEFLSETFYPVVGKRGFSAATRPGGPRPCPSRPSGCILIPGLGTQKNIRIEWTTEPGNIPWVEVEEDSRVLKIPQNTHFKALPDRGHPIIQQLLVGTDLHPFIATDKIIEERLALKEPAIFLKDSQHDAIEALREADQDGQRKMLLVSPTAWGKTEVMKGLLKQRLAGSPQKLHIIIADQNGLTENLTKEMARLQKDTSFNLKHWSGKGESAEDVKKLVREAQHSTKPTVLVTTIQSLKATLKKHGWADGIDTLRPHLATLVYDEAHHTGAPEAKALIEGLIDARGSKATLLGMTATPTHPTVGIQQFFDHNSYWAYLDEGDTYRSIDEVVNQLSTAVQRGELTPFNQTHFLTPQSMGLEGSFFVPKTTQGAGVRWVLDPVKKEPLLKKLLPLFEQHEHGFATVGTTAEADKLTEELNKISPNRRFASFHSKMSEGERKEVKKLYDEGKINHLITVKYLDEGVRMPGMSLYVDLNRNVGPRQFLQRIGRVLALEAGKEQVDVVSLMELDEASVKEHIALIDQILAGKLGLPKMGKAASQKNIVTTPVLLKDAKLSSLSDEEMRRELLTVRKQLQDFWDKKNASPAKSAALQGIAFVEKTGFKHGPDANRHSDLVSLLRQHREDPEFINTILEHPDAFEHLKSVVYKPSQIAGLEAIQATRFSAYAAFPTAETHPELVASLAKFENDPALEKILKTDPKAWKLYQESKPKAVAHVPTEELGIAGQTAQGLIEYIEKSKFTAIPGAGDDRYLHSNIQLYRNYAEFKTTLAKNPRAQEVYERLSGQNQAPSPFNAFSFGKATREAPKTSQPRTQETRSRKGQTGAPVEERSASQRAADSAIEVVRTASVRSVSETLGAANLKGKMIKNRLEPDFIETLRKNPDEMRILVPLIYNEEQQLGLEFMEWSKNNSKQRHEILESEFASKFFPHRNDQGMLDLLNKNPDMREQFESFLPAPGKLAAINAIEYVKSGRTRFSDRLGSIAAKGYRENLYSPDMIAELKPYPEVRRALTIALPTSEEHSKATEYIESFKRSSPNAKTPSFRETLGDLFDQRELADRLLETLKTRPHDLTAHKNMATLLAYLKARKKPYFCEELNTVSGAPEAFEDILDKTSRLVAVLVLRDPEQDLYTYSRELMQELMGELIYYPGFYDEFAQFDVKRWSKGHVQEFNGVLAEYKNTVAALKALEKNYEKSPHANDIKIDHKLFELLKRPDFQTLLAKRFPHTFFAVLRYMLKTSHFWSFNLANYIGRTGKMIDLSSDPTLTQQVIRAYKINDVFTRQLEGNPPAKKIFLEWLSKHSSDSPELPHLPQKGENQ